METKKAKWEIEFERLSTMNIDEEIKNLERKGTNKGEYKENQETIKKLKAFKDNKPKIERLLAFRKKQQMKLAKLKKENQEYKRYVAETKSLGQEEKAIEEEYQKIMQTMTKIDESLKNCKDPDERISLEDEKKTCKIILDKNNAKYIKNQEALQKKLTMQRKPVDNTNQITFLSESISKCNMICESLLNGKSWDDITLKLENWQKAKFTGNLKKQINNSRDNARNNASDNSRDNSSVSVQQDNSSKELTTNRKFDFRHPIESVKRIIEHYNSSKELTTDRKFDFRHPIKSIKQIIEQKRLKDEPEENEEKVLKESEFYKRITEGVYDREKSGFNKMSEYAKKSDEERYAEMKGKER